MRLVAAAMLAVVALSGCHSSRNAARQAEQARWQAEHRPVATSTMSAPTAALVNEANGWLGVPYRYGGENRSGVDCSALVLKVFASSLQIAVPRNSRKQADFCSAVKRDQLIAGDLVFFSTPSSGDIGHVGIYVGDGRMIHASSSRGVIVSSIDEPYFVRHFKKAGRVDAYYAMLDKTDRKKKKPVAEPSPVPDPLYAASEPVAPTPATAAPAQASISLEEYQKMSAAVAARTEKEPEPAAQVVATTAPKPVEPAKPVKTKVEAVKTSAATPAPARDDAEAARRRVLQTFREQPADSVMSAFFE